MENAIQAWQRMEHDLYKWCLASGCDDYVIAMHFCQCCKLFLLLRAVEVVTVARDCARSPSDFFMPYYCVAKNAVFLRLNMTCDSIIARGREAFYLVFAKTLDFCTSFFYYCARWRCVLPCFCKNVSGWPKLYPACFTLNKGWAIFLTRISQLVYQVKLTWSYWYFHLARRPKFRRPISCLQSFTDADK